MPLPARTSFSSFVSSSMPSDAPAATSEIEPVFFADGTPFAERSLPPGMLDAEYRRYVVVRAVPMWRSETANWFGQVCGGTRYRALLAADELVTLGYLAEAKGDED